MNRTGGRDIHKNEKTYALIPSFPICETFQFTLQRGRSV